jgi:AraC-like DNA-binding protein
MIERLDIPRTHAGQIWFYENRGLRYRPHRHRELEINFVLRGSATYLVQGRSVRLTPGALLWLPTDAEHVLLSQSDNFQMYIVVLRPKIAPVRTYRALLRHLQLPEGDVLCRQIVGPESASLRALMSEIRQNPSLPGLYNAGLVYLRERIEFCFQTHAHRPAARTIHPAVESAARLIETSDAELSLDEIAENVHISPARLSHLFKKQLGVGIASYRNRRRIDRAIALCRNGQMKLLTAALQAGFGSYAQFHRVCVGLTGQNPRTLLGRQVADR